MKGFGKGRVRGELHFRKVPAGEESKKKTTGGLEGGVITWGLRGKGELGG